MAERVEDGDEAVDGIEGEGGYTGDVSGGEERGLQEEEEEQRDASVGEGESAVIARLQGGFAVFGSGSGRCEGAGEVQICAIAGLWRRCA